MEKKKNDQNFQGSALPRSKEIENQQPLSSRSYETQHPTEHPQEFPDV